MSPLRPATAAGVTRRITFPRPIPVAVYCTTAAATAGGRVFFREDLHGLDARLDAALRSPGFLP